MRAFAAAGIGGLLMLLLTACSGTRPVGERVVTVEERIPETPDTRRPPSESEISSLTEGHGLIGEKSKGSSEVPGLQKPNTAPPVASPAVIALLDRARAQASAGEGEQAAATLERALRIEPRNPWLWHRLAVLRLQQGNWQQAIELATKSNTLASSNPRLLGGNWQVIGMALEHLGDSGGARQAKAKSQSYLNQVSKPHH